VLLRRRRTEIAMLKTAGYRQGDLYLLFGLEAGLIGLLGGIVGSLAGIGVSFLVKGTVERAFFITLPGTIDPATVASGVEIGFCTALIFGLMPIVQASQIRPLAVLRELPEGARAQSVVMSLLLPLLLATLFFLLALSILRDLALAGIAVGGTVAFLLVLSLLFTLLVVGISRLPVPERVRWWFPLLVVLAGAATFALLHVATGFGILFGMLAVLALAAALLPRQWKSNVKMALRNLGRQKARTVTTMVALYIGVFAIGLILVLGQNIKDQINSFLTSQQSYNSFIVSPTAQKSAVDSALSQGPFVGVPKTSNPITQDVPVAVNWRPIGDILNSVGQSGTSTNRTRNEALFLLSGMQGYDLAAGQVPNATLATDHGQPLGRMLDAGDSGLPNAMLPSSATEAPLSLHVGDMVTVANATGKSRLTVSIVGFYAPSLTTFAPIYTDASVVNTLTNRNPLYVYSLTLDPKTADSSLSQLQAHVPGVQTLTVVDLEQFITALLNNLIVMLEAVASLAMLAGIIIIANAVALAMLERRRELGILKAVGHTSRSVLSGVLLENGVVGFLAGLLAMVLVTVATTILSREVFKTDFGVAVPIVVAIVVASALVCMVVAAGVAWNATRVRPLDVLRYE
jgi:predicted lysophospholipase L1 biosynthesis ABC-type transport system permease subunit